MIFIKRKVVQISSSDDGGYDTKVVALESLRSTPAWVLLGEPGAGKSSAFKQEAKAVNGLHLTMAEFVHSDIDEAWRGKCLFLDGLDEIRASDTAKSILFQVKSKLLQLGRPNFRIACRAADWSGQSDRDDIIKASPDQQLPTYQLQPLSQTDIEGILQYDFKHSDPESFIRKAKDHGIYDLLGNPLTLSLIVKALQQNISPSSRDDIYRLACDALVQEENRKHRNPNRHQPVPKDTLLEAAGQIFATLLLADKSGIALDSSVQHDRYPVVTDFSLPHPEHAAQSIRTALFVPSDYGEERLEPTHRSVAEYLAANWLGKQIDSCGLSLKRVLNLMLGFDGKPVAGLRGLYGWLATKCLKARNQLIENDPVSVVVYSDTSLMTVAEQKLLLEKVRLYMRTNPAILWNPHGLGDTTHIFQVELRNQYMEALLDEKRDDLTQTHVVFILKVIEKSVSQVNLANELHSVAADATRWERIRMSALKAWLDAGATDAEAIKFIDNLNQEVISTSEAISTSNEYLIITLLKKLFPKALSATQALSYLHIPNIRTSGGYSTFWASEFPQMVPEGDLPSVLDQLAQKIENQKIEKLQYYKMLTMLNALVVRGVSVYGDQISNNRLFTWLHMGIDEYHAKNRGSHYDNIINPWLRDRPERYKKLLGICFERNETAPDPITSLHKDLCILNECAAPADIGLWHFQHIDSTRNEELAKKHLCRAVGTLWSDVPAPGLTLDMVFEWAGNDVKKIAWLTPLLVCPMEWQKMRDLSVNPYKSEQDAQKKERSHDLETKLPDIRSGQAHPALMGELAGVWLNHYTNTHGETPLARFNSYCDNYVEVYKAAKAGMPNCIKRSDLPSVKEIIDLHLKQQHHWILAACLLGMDLIWTENPSAVDAVDSNTLETMVCFQLIDGSGKAPEWFLHLVSKMPELVSKILVTYASASFKAGSEYVNGIDPLTNDAAYKQVALVAVPELLRSFPTRNKARQIELLGVLLRAALNYEMPELKAIVAKKLRLRTLDPGQRVYFLIAGALIDPEQCEQKLWDFVGKSWKRIQHISDFSEIGSIDLPTGRTLSAKMLGKMIETLTPHADTDLPIGHSVSFIGPAEKRGLQVKQFILMLTDLYTKESLDELERLLKLPTLEKIKRRLLESKHKVIQGLREHLYRHPTLSHVASILSNRSPTSPADLQAIVLDRLDQIATDIQTNNADLFRLFWTEGSENRHKKENSCRDALLTLLQNYLEPLQIASAPEYDHVNDKRADIRVSYQNKIAIPIEIKGEWNPDLWTAVQQQLMPKYTLNREAGGFGIYVVLWFGGTLQPAARDGDKKPTTPTELQTRLHKHLPEDIQKLIAVRVIDVSIPSP